MLQKYNKYFVLKIFRLKKCQNVNAMISFLHKN